MEVLVLSLLFACLVTSDPLPANPCPDNGSHGNSSLCAPIQPRGTGGGINVGEYPWQIMIYIAKVQNHKNRALLPAPPACGRTIPVSPRIMGGATSQIREFPWMAAINVPLMLTEHSPKTTVLCGGSIINKKYILSAAHCFQDYDKKLNMKIGVLLGMVTLTDEIEAEERHTDNVILHEAYSRYSSENDIALLRVSPDIVFKGIIQPICLPYDFALNEPLNTKYLTFAGWGRKQSEPTIIHDATLRKLAVRSTPIDDCVGIPLRFKVTNRQVCTRGAYMFAQNFCPGDSGGPLMWASRHATYVMGIASWSRICDIREQNQTQVSTRVTSYMLWILDNIY